jgi:hypothetical protein
MLHTDQLPPPGEDMARSNTERSTALRKKRRAEGWLLLHLWVPSRADADLVRAYVARLVKKHRRDK